jgi:hypothetical protein
MDSSSSSSSAAAAASAKPCGHAVQEGGSAVLRPAVEWMDQIQSSSFQFSFIHEGVQRCRKENPFLLPFQTPIMEATQQSRGVREPE